METAKALVVYYSRTGNTREMAKKIAAELNCEIEEIIDKTDRSGIFGYIYAGYQAMRKKLSPIETPRKNPADYDILIIGTPVWGFTLAPPIRTYLKANSGVARKIAFFCSMDGSGDEKTFKALEEAAGQKPVATLSTDKHERKDGYGAKIKVFIEKIKA
ncbi:MAG: flavodoxin family protein [bacterium]